MQSHSRTTQSVVTNLLRTKLAQHVDLDPADEAAIHLLPATTKLLSPGEDIVRQGDRPDAAVFVLSGMLARYHTLGGGDRQYLEFSIAGDLPDAQSLYLDIMDHSVCSMDDSRIALLPHKHLHRLIQRRPAIAAALWRITLVDAAIFRQAITNNGARQHVARLAHFMCEHYLRSRQAGLVRGRSCDLPLSQAVLAQTLGISAISLHRALQRLRRAKMITLVRGKLEILNWSKLARIAEFDATYLHLRKGT
jgi:CRP-like cAMP-binding protein